MSQSRAHSALESVANVLVGCIVSFVAQLLIFPLVGLHASISQNLGIMISFTFVSLARSYLLRRWFNKKVTKP